MCELIVVTWNIIMIKNVTRHKKMCKGYNQGKNACCDNAIALNPFTTIGIYNVIGFY
jgi:hypothetical protein